MNAPRTAEWAVCYCSGTRRGVLAIPRNAMLPSMAEITRFFEAIDARVLTISIVDDDGPIGSFSREILPSGPPLAWDDDATVTKH